MQTEKTYSQELVSNVRPLAWLFLALGIVSIIWPAVATIAVERLIAAFFIMSGIAGLFFWRQFGSGRVTAMGIATSAIALILGVVLAVQPIAGAATLTMILVAALVVEGALNIWMALQWRDANARWIWPLLSGIVTLVLAVMIVSGWPSTAVWAIGLLFGMNLLSNGLVLLALSQTGSR